MSGETLSPMAKPSSSMDATKSVYLDRFNPRDQDDIHPVDRHAGPTTFSPNSRSARPRSVGAWIT